MSDAARESRWRWLRVQSRTDAEAVADAPGTPGGSVPRGYAACTGRGVVSLSIGKHSATGSTAP